MYLLVERVCANCGIRRFRVLPTSFAYHCSLRCRDTADSTKAGAAPATIYDGNENHRWRRIARVPRRSQFDPTYKVGSSFDTLEAALSNLDELQRDRK